MFLNNDNLNLIETDIKRDSETALCRPFSEKYFASLIFGNIV